MLERATNRQDVKSEPGQRTATELAVLPVAAKAGHRDARHTVYYRRIADGALKGYGVNRK